MKKQFLVVRVVKELGEAAVSWIPLPGLFTRQAAETLVEREREDNPGTEFLIQEVGAA